MFCLRRGDWFSPRFSTPASTAALNATHDPGLTQYVLETVNSTATALATAAFDEAKKRVASGTGAPVANGPSSEWTGIGLEWLRSLLGRKEWTLPCIDVKVRL
ncbi:hypothetical protein PRK78_007274 [Emydomyces testavorans]|uniref:Uncharacterized protein n=1 Tax=Emydomyces testavorans TaxID=2070801 RepID=A0AAF0DP21_9EURO|nr:hypothetical protein PRK78_007274 [Emydomyces testavorans]